MIGKVFNYLKYFCNLKKELIFNLKNCSEFMKNGTYQLFPKQAILKTDFKDNLYNNVFIKLCFNQKIDIFTKNKQFNGTKMIITNQKNIKIFSDKEILTFASINEIKNLINQKQIINKFFKYPKILKQTDIYYIEEYIKDEKKVNLNELYDIYEIFLNFYKYQQIKYLNIKTNLIDMNRLSKKNKFFIKDLIKSYDTEYPFVLSHNDLHFENVLKNNSEYYFIDWEYFGFNIFFYDFLNILFIPALDENNEFLHRYLNGDFDDMFKKLFDLFEINFLTKDRLKYIKIYLLQKIILRDIQESTQHLNKTLLKYQVVLKGLNC